MHRTLRTQRIIFAAVCSLHVTNPLTLTIKKLNATQERLNVGIRPDNWSKVSNLQRSDVIIDPKEVFCFRVVSKNNPWHLVRPLRLTHLAHITSTANQDATT